MADTEQVRPSVEIWDDGSVSSQTIGTPRTTGRVSLMLGWAAVLLPVVYMIVVGWTSGEHGGTVILLGLSATLFQLAVWGSVWIVTRHNDSAIRRTTFGAGAAVSPIASLLVLAATVSPAWAVTTYVVTTLVTIAVVALLTARNRRVEG